MLNGKERFILHPYCKSKDFVKSPFRYPGGKFYALKLILPFLSAVTHDEYREPFVGGGSVFFGKKKVAVNWINDLEGDIVEVYKAIADHALSEHLINLLDREIATRERHSQVKDLEPESHLDAVFKTFYLNRTSYSGIINSPAWGYEDTKSSPPQNWKKFIRDVRPKLSDVKITSLDFEEVITAKAKGERVLMYLDPPYFLADQKRAYTKSFVLADHLRLAEILKKTTYYFCLSYDDCAEVRELYSWAHIYEKRWLYNTANNKGEKRKVGNELVITNYQADQPEEFNLFTQLS